MAIISSKNFIFDFVSLSDVNFYRASEFHRAFLYESYSRLDAGRDTVERDKRSHHHMIFEPLFPTEYYTFLGPTW